MKTNKFNAAEKLIFSEVIALKKLSGSHSPSIATLIEKVKGLEMKVDACFLSNPYATELFLNYFDSELIATGKIRDYLEYYPSQNNVLSKVVSSAIGISSDNIFVGNGAIEIIQAVLSNFVGDKILINIPTFSSYYEFVPEGVEIVYNQLEVEDSFCLNIESYLESVNFHKPSSVVLINPNNPDGNYFTQNETFSILDQLKDVELVIIDESFIHFSYENNSYDLISFSNLVEVYPNVVVIKSMSKDFGIAGIRAGYAVMNSTRVRQLQSKGYLWNVNGLAEYFFRLYSRNDFRMEYEVYRKKYIDDAKDFFNSLAQIDGIRVFPSKANFALIEVLQDWDSDSFVMYCLIKHGVYMRTCSDKIGLNGTFIRVAARSIHENSLILKAIKEAVS